MVPSSVVPPTPCSVPRTKPEPVGLPHTAADHSATLQIVGDPAGRDGMHDSGLRIRSPAFWRSRRATIALVSFPRAQQPFPWQARYGLADYRSAHGVGNGFASRRRSYLAKRWKNRLFWPGRSAFIASRVLHAFGTEWQPASSKLRRMRMRRVGSGLSISRIVGRVPPRIRRPRQGMARLEP